MSALEETFALQLRALNFPEPIREYRFAPHRRFRFDFAWVDEKIAVEIDGATWAGGRHNRGAGVNSDCHKYSLAAVHCWRVLRGDAKMVKSGELIKYLELALL